MSPFRPKFQSEALNDYVVVASAIKSWCESSQDDVDSDLNYAVMLKKLEELGFNENDEKSILAALDRLGADEYTKCSASDLYREERKLFLEKEEWRLKQERWRNDQLETEFEDDDS